MAIPVARHAGARHVVVTDMNPFRLELARKMGATLAVNAAETTLQDVQSQLGMLEGFDVGLEMSGNPMALKDMVAALGPALDRLALKAVVEPRVAQVVWYVDGEPFAISDPDQPVFWPIKPGAHRFQLRLPLQDTVSAAVRVVVE